MNSEYLSPIVSTAIILSGTVKVGYAYYRHLTRHRREANKHIATAENEVREVATWVETDLTLEIDDVTDVVSSQALDVMDNTITVQRKVKRRQKAPFRAYLVKIGKAKFGLLKRNEANKMCVRKFLYDACVIKGVLARHIIENIDFATEMVFIPMAYELNEMAVRSTTLAKDRDAVAAVLGRDCNHN
jgi:hypothetical protein